MLFKLNKIEHITILVLLAICSISYELIFSQTLTIAFGETVTRYSMTIGLFLFSLGIGTILGQQLLNKYLYVRKNINLSFFFIEILISIFAILGFIFILYFSSSLSLELILSPIIFKFILIISHIPIIIIGIISGIEIPFFIHLSQYQFSNVLAIDYVGSLMGTILFSIVLYPHIGIAPTLLFIALINFFLAFYILYRKKLIILFAILLLSIVLIFAQPITNITLKNFYKNIIERNLTSQIEETNDIEIEIIKPKIKILTIKPTQYANIITYQDQYDSLIKPTWCLSLDKHPQFCDSWVKEYHNGLVDVPMSYIVQENNPLDILIVGGGDFIAVDYLRKYDSKITSVDLVDINKKFLEYSKKTPEVNYFNNGAFNYKKLTVYNNDAYQFLLLNSKKYDLIIMDLPGLSNDKILHLYSKETFSLIKNSLKLNGIFTSWRYSEKHSLHNEILKNTLASAGFLNGIFYDMIAYDKVNDYIYKVDSAFILSKQESLKFTPNKNIPNKLLQKYNKTLVYKKIPTTQTRINSIFSPNYNLIIKK